MAPLMLCVVPPATLLLSVWFLQARSWYMATPARLPVVGATRLILAPPAMLAVAIVPQVSVGSVYVRMIVVPLLAFSVALLALFNCAWLLGMPVMMKVPGPSVS